MPETSRARVEIKVEHVRPSEGTGTRDAFWSPIIQQSAGVTFGTEDLWPKVEAVEAALKNRLGTALREELREYFAQSGAFRRGPEGHFATMPERFALLLPLVGFEVRYLNYGSLDLTLEIAGAKNLASLFEGNLDLFLIFLHGYLPAAFQTATNLDPSGLTFNAFPSADLASVFASANAPVSPEPAPPMQPAHTPQPASPAPTPSPVPPATDRLKSAWLIANYSLVVPVLLSLLVLYVWAKGLSEERAELQALHKELLLREQALVKISVDRSLELDKQQSALVGALKPQAQPATKP